MSHEIGEHDKVVLHKEQAWHGLGTVVEDAPTPAEAIELAGLGWHVDQWPLVAVQEGGERLAIESHLANVRRDTQTQLGIVGNGYKPVQNVELAEFAAGLAKDGDVVRCESAGSIRDGRKVWFLLKGQSFSVRGDSDEVVPYILVSNGHDGGTAVRCTPTSIRVVCSNTLHLVIPKYESKSNSFRWGKGGKGLSILHLGDVKAKIEDARRAVKLYEHALDDSRERLVTLASKDVTRDQLQTFWLDVYQRHFQEVPVTPTNDAERGPSVASVRSPTVSIRNGTSLARRRGTPPTPTPAGYSASASYPAAMMAGSTSTCSVRTRTGRPRRSRWPRRSANSTASLRCE